MDQAPRQICRTRCIDHVAHAAQTLWATRRRRASLRCKRACGDLKPARVVLCFQQPGPQPEPRAQTHLDSPDQPALGDGFGVSGLFAFEVHSASSPSLKCRARTAFMFAMQSAAAICTLQPHLLGSLYTPSFINQQLAQGCARGTPGGWWCRCTTGFT